MGVPAFFRWLSMKYALIVSHCIEEKPRVNDDDTIVEVDINKPNPNDIEFDNLYLDMNGIIHPCTHPENKPAPTNEEEMFHEIFLYIDRIMSICRPRRLIYLAVDGVAPRAKMNQQRSRRFRAGKESREKRMTIENLRQELLMKGATLPDKKDDVPHFDSNCITPGTPFMERLSVALRFYIYKKLTQDDGAGWANLQVILSDSNAPGEGEHKIMDFIRRQRHGSSNYDVNTRHILCGADADLIMLGLATHEPHFTIIREEFKPNQQSTQPCEICGKSSHKMEECVGLVASADSVEFNSTGKTVAPDTEFIFIHINILREYLQQELVFSPNIKFKYDFERAIDDWVFICFFVGNDFLPHLPSLEIREKAIDRLVELYKSVVEKTDGWLTDSGVVNLQRVQLMMKDLALVEDNIFISRRNNEMDMRQRQQYRRQNVNKRIKLDNNVNVPMVRVGEKFTDNFQVTTGSKRKASEAGLDIDEDPEDKKNRDLDGKDEVKLYEVGYRKRYYQSKFGVDVDENPEFCKQLGHQYVRGLCWVLAYYYQGCCSWTWYYPYHYAPFAIDFSEVASTDVKFQRNSKPFNPLEQLMGVFPADSKSHVPPAWHSLMTDSNSPVIDFYPTNFKIDLNGKRYEWQGVALLPFVDETRLLKALDSRKHLLTDAEIRRNIRTPDRYFIRSDHPYSKTMNILLETSQDSQFVIDTSLTEGVSGNLSLDESTTLTNSNLESPVPNFHSSISQVKVVAAFYQDKEFPESFSFPAKLLENVKMPENKIGPNSVRKERLKFNTAPMNRMVNHSLNYSKSYTDRPTLNQPNYQQFNQYQQRPNYYNNNYRNNNYNNYNNNQSMSNPYSNRPYQFNQYPRNNNPQQYNNQYGGNNSNNNYNNRRHSYR